MLGSVGSRSHVSTVKRTIRPRPAPDPGPGAELRRCRAARYRCRCAGRCWPDSGPRCWLEADLFYAMARIRSRVATETRLAVERERHRLGRVRAARQCRRWSDVSGVASPAIAGHRRRSRTDPRCHRRGSASLYPRRGTCFPAGASPPGASSPPGSCAMLTTLGSGLFHDHGSKWAVFAQNDPTIA